MSRLSGPAELRVPRLYVLADVERLGGVAAVVPALRAAAAAGVEWVQLRAKTLGDRSLLSLAREAQRLAPSLGLTVWLDDRADIAALSGVSGVHVGQSDLPPAVVRQVVGGGVWIGRSTHDRQQLIAAAEDAEVDLIAVGPVFETHGKSDPDPVVGLEFVRWASRQTDKPIVAIGGIDESRVGEVLAAGAASAAVLGAACSGDVGEGCRRLLAAASGAAA